MKVSCVCPSGDRPTYLQQAVDCFLSQTYENSELLIIDDGMVPMPKVMHPRIRHLYLPRANPRLITGMKRNVMNALAQGEIIIHWDDDDYSCPTRVVEQVAFLESSGAEVVGYPDCYFFRETDRRVWNYRFLGGSMPYAVGTTLCYWRRWWADHHFQSKPIGEDTLFAYEATNANKLACCPNNGRVVARNLSTGVAKVNFANEEFVPATWEELPEGFRKMVGE